MPTLPRRDAPRLLTELWEQRQSHPQAASFASIGKLAVRSGALCATDPLTAADRPAFTRSVPSGEHAVFIAEHTDGVAGVAFIQLGEGVPRRWTIATRAGEDAATLGPNDVFGFAVDGGIAAVFDPIAAKALASAPDVHDLTVRPLGKKLATLIDLPGAANALVVRSGDGDGFYAAWWGEDQAGALVALALDFRIFRQLDTAAELEHAALAPFRDWAARATALLDEVLRPLGFSPAVPGMDEPEQPTSVVARATRDGITVQLSQSLDLAGNAIDTAVGPCLSAGPPGDELCVELPEVADEVPDVEGADEGFDALAALLRQDAKALVKALLDEVAERA